MHESRHHDSARHAVMAWQDDMFLRAGWLVPELVANVRRVRRYRAASA